jgi:branched-chain amino acid transport system permease protein
MTVYLLSLVILIAIAAINGLGLNMQWGFVGLINFGLFGFYMLSAYITAQCSVTLGWNPWLAMLAATVATALVSAMVCLISLRLEGDYLAIVTLGFAECLKLVIIHEDGLTRGSLGIANIPRLTPGGDAGFAICAVGLLAVVYAIFETIARSPLGRAARAVRDDPVVAATFGKSVLAIRLKFFSLGGTAIGLGGSLHAFYYHYIDPLQFSSIITAYAFMVVILGGRASNPGTVLSAAALVLFLEGTRFLNDYAQFFSAQQIASLRLIAIGVALVGMLIVRPQGLFHEYRLRCAGILREGSQP